MKKNSVRSSKLIYTHGAGRLGNQLLQFAHLLAWCLENEKKVTLINLSFYPYLNLLEEFYNQPIAYYPNSGSPWLFWGFCLRMLPEWISRKIYSRLSLYSFECGRFLPGCQSMQDEFMFGGENIDLGNSSFLSMVQCKSMTFLRGWHIRSWYLLDKHQIKVREILRFKQKYVNEAEEFVKKARGKHDFIVGVFLRQGDYRRWEDGKYFFESNQYLEWMNQLENLYKDKNIGFLIMSSEEQGRDIFMNRNQYFGPATPPGQSHYVTNLHSLALCDLIMSPPSTFAGWAAFIGKVPLLALYDKNQKLREVDILNGGIFEARAHDHFKISLK